MAAIVTLLAVSIVILGFAGRTEPLPFWIPAMNFLVAFLTLSTAVFWFKLTRAARTLLLFLASVTMLVTWGQVLRYDTSPALIWLNYAAAIGLFLASLVTYGRFQHEPEEETKISVPASRVKNVRPAA